MASGEGPGTAFAAIASICLTRWVRPESPAMGRTQCLAPHPDRKNDPTSPRKRRAVPGMIHYAAAHARQIQREPDTFWLSRHRKGPGMQYVNSIFGELL